MPVSNRVHIPAAGYFLLILILTGIFLAVRAGMGADHFRQNLPEALQKAQDWDPANPVYPAALANLDHLYSENADPGRVIQLYQAAHRLSPFDAAYTADLAQANDWAGHSAIAGPLFQRAEELFPNSPEINWKLANFYVRTGKAIDALPPLKTVLSSNVIPKNQVFALCDSARIDPLTVLDNLLPHDSPTFLDYLNFQTGRKNFTAAEETWDRLLSLQGAFEPKDAFQFLDALIKSREIDRASQVWSALVARFPNRVPSPAPTNLIVNGDFQADILNGGFDWRVYSASGVSVTHSAVGPGSDSSFLRIEFDGTQNLYYGSVLQFVRVQPDTKYDFSAISRSDALTTDSGLCLQISDAYDATKILGTTEPFTGTTPWSEQKISFTTDSETHLVIVRIVRYPSQKLDNKIAGAFSIRHVSLLPRS